MWSILADLCIGLFDFVMDVLLFRALRRKHGRGSRSVAEDTFAVARFDFATMLFIALVCVALMLFLAFGLGFPAAWSAGIGIGAGAIWGVWRYARLVRER